MSMYGVVLFHNTTEAFRAEKAIGAACFKIKLIPTPREFSADCGIALQFDWGKAGEIRQTIEAGQLSNAGIREMKL